MAEKKVEPNPERVDVTIHVVLLDVSEDDIAKIRHAVRESLSSYGVSRIRLTVGEHRLPRTFPLS